MKMITKYSAFAILIFTSLLFTPSKMHAVLAASPNVETIEIQKNNRKKLGQERRKVKRSKHQKRQFNRTIGYIALTVLYIASGFFSFGLGALIVNILMYGSGYGIVWGALACVLLSFLSIWGAVHLSRALRKTKKNRIKNGL